MDKFLKVIRNSRMHSILNELNFREKWVVPKGKKKEITGYSI